MDDDIFLKYMSDLRCGNIGLGEKHVFNVVERKPLEYNLRTITPEHRKVLGPYLSLGQLGEGTIDGVLGTTPAAILHYVTMRNGLSYVELRKPDGSEYERGDAELYHGIVNEPASYIKRGDLEIPVGNRQLMKISGGVLDFESPYFALPDGKALKTVWFDDIGSPKHSAIKAQLPDTEGYFNRSVVYEIFPGNIRKLRDQPPRVINEERPFESLTDREKFERSVVQMHFSAKEKGSEKRVGRTVHFYQYNGFMITDDFTDISDCSLYERLSEMDPIAYLSLHVWVCSIRENRNIGFTEIE